MKCPKCVVRTAKKAARAMVVVVAVPVALCVFGVLGCFMGGGDIKSS